MRKWSTFVGMMAHPGFSETPAYTSFLIASITFKSERVSDLEINYMATGILTPFSVVLHHSTYLEADRGRIKLETQN